MIRWWERNTFPQDEEMNRRVREINEETRD